MLNRYFDLLQILYFLLSIDSNDGFICPRDGRWPHPADCEKFYNCDSGIGIEAWCGNGMTYDIEHSRCDLSKNIDCKNGERPDWNPPSNWQTEIITEKMIIETSSNVFDQNRGIERARSLTINPTTISSSKAAFSRMLLPNRIPIEKTPCTFQGTLPDPDDCQSYLMCQNEIVTRLPCPEKHSYDEDLHSCNDYRKVYCRNRPIHEHANDPCIGQPNGWYPDYGSQCRLYYLCTDQRKTKSDQCPSGSKWNPYRLHCDDPRYIIAPCGYRVNNNAHSFIDHRIYRIILLTFPFFFIF